MIDILCICITEIWKIKNNLFAKYIFFIRYGTIFADYLP